MATPNIGKGRLLRVCDECGLVDDHPRHIIAGTQRGIFAEPRASVVRAVTRATIDFDEAEADRLMAELLDTSSVTLHYDCCREAGCPDGSCDLQTAGAEDKRGSALLKHLVAQEPERITTTVTYDEDGFVVDESVARQSIVKAE